MRQIRVYEISTRQDSRSQPITCSMSDRYSEFSYYTIRTARAVAGVAGEDEGGHLVAKVVAMGVGSGYPATDPQGRCRANEPRPGPIRYPY